MNIVSFYVYRPNHPRAVDYLPLIAELQRSCDRFGLRHVILTDRELPGYECFVRDVPDELMKAQCLLQWSWMVDGDWCHQDTLFVGVDCLIVRDPRQAFAGKYDMAVTFRPGHPIYPINIGTVCVRNRARDRAALLYDKIAIRCIQTGAKWGDDQRAFEHELGPMPKSFGTYDRAGLRVAFLPMAGFNETPRAVGRPIAGAVAHFRGKERKSMMVPWAKKWIV